MANLTQSEKELLAVVRYYANNKKAIAKLLVKLGNNFGDEVTSSMTGLTDTEINSLVFSYASKRNATKAIGNAKKAPAKPNKAAKETAATEAVEGSERLAIHLNSESDLVTRIADDVTKAIESELKPGDPFWRSRVLIDRFGARSNTAPLVNKILVEHNWIQPVDESNKRKGYMVK